MRPVLEYCAPVWHYALTKAQSASIEAVQKHAMHIYNSTHGMPYLSMLFYANLNSLASRRENLSHGFFTSRCNIYISRLCYDVSVRLTVCLSVTEVHWRIIANLGFKLRSQFTAHCGRCAAGGAVLLAVLLAADHLVPC